MYHVEEGQNQAEPAKEVLDEENNRKNAWWPHWAKLCHVLRLLYDSGSTPVCEVPVSSQGQRLPLFVPRTVVVRSAMDRPPYEYHVPDVY
ncbi:hypothetical protein PS2_035230 [Malus domestica]